MNRVMTFFMLEKNLDDLRKGKSNTLIISGNSGIGKSYTVNQNLEGYDFIVFKGGITSASALYKTLFVNNHPDKIIVFDDLDGLFSDTDCVNILKGALDTGERTLSYISRDTVDPLLYKILRNNIDYSHPDVISALRKKHIDIEKFSRAYIEKQQLKASNPYAYSAILPQTFTFKSKVIFITNLFIDQLPAAIRSRGGAKIDINLTTKEIVEHISSLVWILDVPGGDKFNNLYAAKKDAIRFIKTLDDDVSLDFRTYYDICRFADSGVKKEVWWQWAEDLIAINNKKSGRKKRES